MVRVSNCARWLAGSTPRIYFSRFAAGFLSSHFLILI
jgi:hypothetical protein